MIDLAEERALLAGLLVEPGRVEEVSRIIRAEDLSSPHLRALWSWMDGDGRAVAWDEIGIHRDLVLAGEYDRCGGVDLLGTLIDHSRPPAALVGVASRVARLGHLRRIAAHATDAATIAETSPHALAGALQRLRATIDAPDPGDASTGALRPLGAIVDATADQWASRRAKVDAGEPICVPIQIKALRERLCGGLFPKDFVILAGRPGSGKTSLGLQIADHAASRGVGVYIASLEMTSEQLLLRLLGQLGPRPHLASDVRAGRLTVEELDDLRVEAHRLYGKFPLYVDDTPTQGIDYIRASVLRAVEAHPEIGLVVIDYLQLITGRAGGESRRLEVEHSSRVLKNLAKEIDRPVLALAQLNRGCDQQGRRPKMSDLREAGGIEQDADTIILLHRLESGITEIVVDKQRYGETGVVLADWDGSRTLFYDLSLEREIAHKNKG